MKKWLVGIFILLILAACTPVQSPEVEPALTAAIESKPTATREETLPDPTETAVPMEQSLDAESDDTARTEPEPASEEVADVLVVFERSGGYAGLLQQWTIYTDGRIDMPDGSQKQVGTEQIEALLAAIQSANVFALNDSYIPADSCCDQFSYTITMHLDDGVKRIDTIDNAPKQPEQVTAVLNTINNLLSTAK